MRIRQRVSSHRHFSAAIGLFALLLFRPGYGEIKIEPVIRWHSGWIEVDVFVPARTGGKSAVVARSYAEQVALKRGQDKLLEATSRVLWVRGKMERVSPEPLRSSVVQKKIEYWGDGSVTGTFALALETLRQHWAPSPATVLPGKKLPSSLFVSAKVVMRKPGLGYQLKAGDTLYEGPLVFQSGKEKIDARLIGKKSQRIKSKTVVAGVISLDANYEDLLISLQGTGVPVVLTK